MTEKKENENGLIAKNRKAYFDYQILEEIEVGIALLGSEVKSLRVNSCNITDSYADIRTINANNEIILLNLHISEYKGAKNFSHTPLRERKLLLHKREIKKLIGKIKLKGQTLIPLSIYFNKKGFVKIKLGVCVGKNKGDKREVIKQREWSREKKRVLKNSEK